VTAAEVASADVKILNQRGLHARAAEQFDADIQVSKDDQTVPGTSILGLMMLAASMGTLIHIEATGDERDAAVAALVTLIEKRFDED
jgi:phosphocarrier protein HPr